MPHFYCGIFPDALAGFVERPAFKSPHRANEGRITAQETGRQFARLIFDALQSPATVDRNELLAAASHFLDAARAAIPMDCH